MLLCNSRGIFACINCFSQKPRGSSFKALSYLINAPIFTTVSKKLKLARKWFMKVKKTLRHITTRTSGRFRLIGILVTWCLMVNPRRCLTCGAQHGAGQLRSEKAQLGVKLTPLLSVSLQMRMGRLCESPITKPVTSIISLFP